jgi:hypothetical protein
MFWVQFSVFLVGFWLLTLMNLSFFLSRFLALDSCLYNDSCILALTNNPGYVIPPHRPRKTGACLAGAGA